MSPHQHRHFRSGSCSHLLNLDQRCRVGGNNRLLDDVLECTVLYASLEWLQCLWVVTIDCSAPLHEFCSRLHTELHLNLAACCMTDGLSEAGSFLSAVCSEKAGTTQAICVARFLAHTLPATTSTFRLVSPPVQTNLHRRRNSKWQIAIVILSRKLPFNPLAPAVPSEKHWNMRGDHI